MDETMGWHADGVSAGAFAALITPEPAGWCRLVEVRANGRTARFDIVMPTRERALAMARTAATVLWRLQVAPVAAHPPRRQEADGDGA